MTLSPLHIEDECFKDDQGRTVILRGVNLGGDCKVPYPKGGTDRPTDFSDHRDVSFIGRPFPLEEAEEHFSRLKAWGFNVLRLLTTWEAIEHRGPYLFDEAYLDYFASLCRMAGDYGLYVFVDFHQDVWSRMSGGDGAPCWLFEKIGLDYTRFGAADAALVMQHVYDYDSPRPRQDTYPPMCWQANYRYPVNGIMWTLFFAGRELTPDFLIRDELSEEEVNVQRYLQGHYLACQEEVAKRVQAYPHLLGFDTLNEPSPGWIGKAMDTRPAKGSKDNPPLPGIACSPVEALYWSHGYSLELPYHEVRVLKGGIVPVRQVVLNPNKVSIWLEGAQDPFMEAGAWKLNNAGTYKVLRNDFFQKVEGREIRFGEDCLVPFWQAVAESIRKYNPDWIVFAEKEAAEGMMKPGFPDKVPENIVNASHWYDGLTLMTKKFRPFNIDIATYQPAIGYKAIEKKYIRELGRIKKSSKGINGGCPTLIGEFGIPFDLDEGKAYRKDAKGDHSSRPWKKHILALDLIYNALDHLLLHSTHWNYTAHNRNDLRIGDCWNQEDLSLYSIDQRHRPADIQSGGRAMEGWVRPFVRYVQGSLRKMRFSRREGIFVLEYRADPRIHLPTEIFVPELQYPIGFDTKIDGADVEVLWDDADRLLKLSATEEGKVSVTVRRKGTTG